MSDNLDDGFWVFGYGSLIWHPGFAFARRHVAGLDGYGRSFCMRSIHHRGTPDAPGLVLALDRAAGASCRGVAFQVAPEHAAGALAGLRARELISSAYLEQRHRVQLDNGESVVAICYVVDQQHVQYCGGLALEEQARIIARASGGRGSNREYLFNTVEHLRALGINDPEMEMLALRVRALTDSADRQAKSQRAPTG